MKTYLLYKRSITFLILYLCISLVGCNDDNIDYIYDDSNTYYEELYRPMLHFTPQKYWMNDPNGMVYLDGEYHLYYQYNPQAAVWGNMSWGHAVSKDLIQWEHLPVAMTKDNLGEIFSGCAIVDVNNTAGFGENALIAIYTSSGERQTQSIAYSLDKGRTFEKYAGNPVLPNDGRADFRDPKVFWYEEGNYWVMTIATSQTISFYRSDNLKTWNFLSEFGEGVGAHGGVWECPDLIKMSYSGDDKWVLLVSINPGGPNGGSATQYFIGSFDGVNFVADSLPYPMWLDYGKDNYAGVTWSNEPTGRHLFIGWMSNWQYAGIVPSMTWRGAATLPRELTLKSHPSGYPVLASDVIADVSIIANQWQDFSNSSYIYDLHVERPYELNISIIADKNSKGFFTLKNEIDEKVVFELDCVDNKLIIDRSASGVSSFSNDFRMQVISPIDAITNKIDIKLYIDYSSIECVLNDGIIQQTNLVYPQKIYSILDLSYLEGAFVVEKVALRTFDSIW